MLNSSGESGQPCLVPDLRGNCFSFSPLRMMLAVGLSYMAFILFSLLSDHLAGYRILDPQLFLLGNMMMLFHCLLASVKTPAIGVIAVYF